MLLVGAGGGSASLRRRSGDVTGNDGATCEPGAVSIEVPLEELARAVAERGPLAYLVTVGDVGPRVVSVSARVEPDGTVRVEAGRHTTANVVARPAVTLFWPVDAEHPKQTLLVDGAAMIDGGELVVMPSSAMLHRVRTGRGAAGPGGAAGP
jgi:hypothetical protein